MKVLVAGSGYVGDALCDSLRRDGEEVYSLSRSSREDGNHISADLTVPSSLVAIPKGIAELVYCAAATGYTDELYREIYVEGFRNILSALDHSILRRVIFVSSTGVYHQQDGEEVDETSPTSPESFSGKRLLEGEALLPPQGIALRLGGIYGPGRGRLISQLRSGAPLHAAALSRFTNRIHRDDCVGALTHLLKIEKPARLYLGVDCEPAPLGEIAKWICGELRIPFPKVVSEGEVGNLEMRGNKRCVNRRLLDSGYCFKFPTYREGFGGG